MSYRGTQKIKGKTYVYEATAIWDPDKHRSEQKRIYIGTQDPDTVELIPNKRYYELYPQTDKPSAGRRELHVMRSSDYGNIYLMQQTADKCGLTGILKECFPTNWQEILSCAMHCYLENEALYLCEQWASNAYGIAAPSSQRISDLLRELDEDRRMMFYKRWAALRAEKEYLALDISSISSWSELINYVERGYNRDHEKLSQINLAMLFGEKSYLPVFIRIYPGSIHDASVLAGMVTFIEQLSLKQMHFVMDKGFYSEPGLQLLADKYIKFACGVPFTTKFAKELVSGLRYDLANPLNAIEVDGHVYYATSVLGSLGGKRVYYHIYFDNERRLNESNALMRKVIKLEKELELGHRKNNAPEAKKYFTFQKTKDDSYNIHCREDAINGELLHSEYFLVLTNESKDSQHILEVYRTKDVVEKSFDNIKNDLDLHRFRIHSDKAMEGRIFIGFISLIITSCIRNKMREQNLYKNHSFNTVIAELKKLRVIEFRGGKRIFTELTATTQKAIYKAMDIKLPLQPSI